MKVIELRMVVSDDAIIPQLIDEIVGMSRTDIFGVVILKDDGFGRIYASTVPDDVWSESHEVSHALRTGHTE